METTISWEDFSKIDMRTGTVTAVYDFPEARNPSFKLDIDFGPEIGVKKTSAQITEKYDKEDIVGLQVIAVVNFPKKQIANFMSECLLIGAVDDKDVTLLEPGRQVKNGLRIS